MASRDSGHVLWSEDELKVLPIPTVSVALRVVVRSGHGSLSKFVVSRQNLALRRRTLLLVCIVLIYLSLSLSRSDLRALVQDFDDRCKTEFLRAPRVIRQAIILECTPGGKHPCQRFEKGSSPSVWLSGALTNYRRTIDTIKFICERNNRRFPSFTDPELLRKYSKEFVQRSGGFVGFPQRSRVCSWFDWLRWRVSFSGSWWWAWCWACAWVFVFGC